MGLELDEVIRRYPDVVANDGVSPWPDAAWTVDVVGALVEHSLVTVRTDVNGESRLSMLVSVGALALGTWLAFAQVRYDYFGNGLLSLLSTLPLAVPSYLLAAIIRESLAPRGDLGNLCQF